MKFSLNKGEIDEFAIIEENLPEDLNNLYIDTNVKVKLSVSDKAVAIVNTVKYINIEKVILKITSTLYFKIEEESWQNLIKGENIIFEKEKVQHLGAIVIGTTRGMLIAKCQNTPYSKIILPPISVKELLPEDIIFKNEILEG